MRGVALSGLVDAGVAAGHEGLLAPGVVAETGDDGAGFVGDGGNRALDVAVEVAGLGGRAAFEAEDFANRLAGAVQGVAVFDGAVAVLGLFVMPALVDAGVEVPRRCGRPRSR